MKRSCGLLAVVAVMGAGFAACAGGGDSKSEEPVEAGDKAESSPSAKLPDRPGDPGEAEGKPAGEGAASLDAHAKQNKDGSTDGGGGEQTASPAPGKGSPEGDTQKKNPSNGEDKTMARDMYVHAWALNVRAGPGMEHGRVRILDRGAKVRIEACENIWCRIEPGQFVSRKFLGERPPEAKDQEKSN